MKYFLCVLFAAVSALGATRHVIADEFTAEVKPLLKKYCVECHSGSDPNGEIDYTLIITPEDIDKSFQVWQRTAERLMDREMPPEGELQPTELQRSKILKWYQSRFVDSVQARPGHFRPRRLSATEYRNTLLSLFGFDLEVAIIAAEQTKVEKSLVMKLLPEDPPGRSGFRNDTHNNPLTTVIWNQYSYLTDHALSELFAESNRVHLEAYCGPIDDQFTAEHADRLLRRFVPKAFRRPVDHDELSAIIQRVSGRPASKSVEDAVKTEMKTVLMSPRFLYRGLSMNRQIGQHPVDDFELAERLSYFLWGDMPDRALIDLAAAGSLGEDAVLTQQVDRMLASEKARHLAQDFAFQWLDFGEIEHTTDNFPLRQSLYAQAIDFMHYLFSEERPLMELIDSQVTFINPLIAKFYSKDRKQMKAYRKPKGIEVEFVRCQKIKLEHTVGRGGILTMPGVVAMNKGPVLRGTWMLERILGDELPDPPMDVGVVPPNEKGQKLTFRERFELHRDNRTCAVCHDRIDPLGFALQRYRQDGSYLAPGSAPAAETKKKKKRSPAPVDSSVDTSGRLPSGERFQDMKGLKQVLITAKRDVIIRNIVERTLSYALCRELEIHDQPVVDKIVSDLDQGDGTYGDLFRSVVTSLPFRQVLVEAD